MELGQAPAQSVAGGDKRYGLRVDNQFAAPAEQAEPSWSCWQARGLAAREEQPQASADEYEEEDEEEEDEDDDEEEDAEDEDEHEDIEFAPVGFPTSERDASERLHAKAGAHRFAVETSTATGGSAPDGQPPAYRFSAGESGRTGSSEQCRQQADPLLQQSPPARFWPGQSRHLSVTPPPQPPTCGSDASLHECKLSLDEASSMAVRQCHGRPKSTRDSRPGQRHRQTLANGGTAARVLTEQANRCRQQEVLADNNNAKLSGATESQQSLQVPHQIKRHKAAQVERDEEEQQQVLMVGTRLCQTTGLHDSMAGQTQRLVAQVTQPVVGGLFQADFGGFSGSVSGPELNQSSSASYTPHQQQPQQPLKQQQHNNEPQHASQRQQQVTGYLQRASASPSNEATTLMQQQENHRVRNNCHLTEQHYSRLNLAQSQQPVQPHPAIQQQQQQQQQQHQQQQNQQQQQQQSQQPSQQQPLQRQQYPLNHPLANTKHLCSICGDRATGKHYGVYSCEGCKGFFKRTIRKDIVYACRAEGNCLIDMRQRNRCQFCRYQKCLRQGMKREAVQEEKQRLKLRACMDAAGQLNTPTNDHNNNNLCDTGQAGNSSLISVNSFLMNGHQQENASAQPYNNNNSLSAHNNNNLKTSDYLSDTAENHLQLPVVGDNAPLMSLQQHQPSPQTTYDLHLCTTGSSSYSDHSDAHSPSLPMLASSAGYSSTPQQGANYMQASPSPHLLDNWRMRSYHHDQLPSPPSRKYARTDEFTLKWAAQLQIESLLDWVRSVAKFNELLMDDRITLLKAHWNELIISEIAFKTAETLRDTQFQLSQQHPRSLCMGRGLFLNESQAHLIGLGKMFERIYDELVLKMHMIRLDANELACLRAVILFNPETQGLKTSQPIEEYRGHVYQALEMYCRESYETQPNRFGKLLLRLPALRSIGLKCDSLRSGCDTAGPQTGNNNNYNNDPLAYSSAALSPVANNTGTTTGTTSSISAAAAKKAAYHQIKPTVLMLKPSPSDYPCYQAN